MTNCVNCGAPIALDARQCPYCTTPYFDLTAIDFDARKPCAVKFKINGMIITQLAYPRMGSINMSSNYVYAESAHGQPIVRFETSKSLETDVSFENEYGESSVTFEAVPNKNGHLMEVRIE